MGHLPEIFQSGETTETGSFDALREDTDMATDEGFEDLDLDDGDLAILEEVWAELDEEDEDPEREDYAKRKPAKGQGGFNFEEKHPRDEDGKFTSGGGGGGGGGGDPPKPAEPAKPKVDAEPSIKRGGKTRDLTAAEKKRLDAAHERYLDKSGAAKTVEDEKAAWKEYQEYLESNSIRSTLAGYRTTAEQPGDDDFALEREPSKAPPKPKPDDTPNSNRNKQKAMPGFEGSRGVLAGQMDLFSFEHLAEEWRERYAAEWDESKHPRDGGKFATKPGAKGKGKGKPKAKAKPKSKAKAPPDKRGVPAKPTTGLKTPSHFPSGQPARPVTPAELVNRDQANAREAAARQAKVHDTQAVNEAAKIGFQPNPEHTLKQQAKAARRYSAAAEAEKAVPKETRKKFEATHGERPFGAIWSALKEVAGDRGMQRQVNEIVRDSIELVAEDPDAKVAEHIRAKLAEIR